MPNFLFKKIPKGLLAEEWQEKKSPWEGYAQSISYIKKIPRITKSAEAWLIKYCSTDLISIKLKEL